MGPSARIAVAALVVAVAAGAAWYFLRSEPPPPPPPPPVAQVKPAPPPEPPPPEIHPVPEAPKGEPAPPLPALDQSDKAAAEALVALVGAGAFERYFVPESLVRHIVVTVDNLPRRSMAMRLAPLKPIGGYAPTTGKDATLALSPESAARYAPWVELFAKLPTAKAVAAYVRFYPLFQKAYEELGYPKGHFNTRLVQVIDHLLTAPEPAEPVALVVRHVLPEYADPALESESAGRKILFRMGNANAAKVKAKLRELRRALVKAG